MSTGGERTKDGRERKKPRGFNLYFIFQSGEEVPPPPFSVCMDFLNDKRSPERLSFRLSETTFKNCILHHVYIGETEENKYSSKIFACIYAYILKLQAPILMAPVPRNISTNLVCL